MEKCNIAYLVSLKCEVSSHYSSNCLLWQRCCLLCTCHGEYNAARTCAEIQSGSPPRLFCSTHRTAVSTKNIVSQNTIRNCTVKLHFYVLYIWSIDGNCVVDSGHPSAINGPAVKFNHFFRTAVNELVTYGKFGFLIEKIARHLKQYLFCVSTQHVPLFLSIILNWSVEGNFKFIYIYIILLQF